MDKGLIVVILIVGLVILFNVGMILSLLNPSTRDQVNLFRNVLRKARNPWQEQDDALALLRTRVKELNTDRTDQEQADDREQASPSS